MKHDLVVRARADVDVDEHALYFARSSLNVAIRFLDRVWDSFQRIASNPDLGFADQMTTPRLGSVRVWPVRDFPNHLIYYREIDRRVEIIRVLHAARNPAPALDD